MSNNISLKDAVDLLRRYSCNDHIGINTETEKQQIREALLLVVELSDWQNLGICAENSDQALKTLVDYLKVFNYPDNLDTSHSNFSHKPTEPSYESCSWGKPPRPHFRAAVTVGQLNFSKEPIYLKYNSQKQSYYFDEYTGEYRGVLVAVQGENEDIIGTYGHFPLDLFS